MVDAPSRDQEEPTKSAWLLQLDELRKEQQQAAEAIQAEEAKATAKAKAAVETGGRAGGEGA